MKVTDIMSRPIYAVRPETPIKDAARFLVERGVSALPVLNGRGSLVGIVSEADIMRLEARPDPRAQATPPAMATVSVPRTVADVMTRDVVTVNADTEVWVAARTMLEARIKRVPVVAGRKVLGIVSRRDLVRVIARHDEAARWDLASRLADLGLREAAGTVRVEAGLATVELEGSGPERRLAESLALSVPGVLEVRVEHPRTSARR